MAATRRSFAFALVLTIAGLRPCLGQDTAAPAAPPQLAAGDMESFLQNAKIMATKSTKKGVTAAKRVTLSDGRVTHDAQIQDVDIALAIFEVGPKNTEVDFKDTYRYNIAGYRLSRLLGLDNVPMSVERKINGKPAAMTWWIDDVILDEGARQKKHTVGPNPSRTASQIHILRVFDELIQNRDRNAGNLLWTCGLEDVDDRPHACVPSWEGSPEAAATRARRSRPARENAGPDRTSADRDHGQELDEGRDSGTPRASRCDRQIVR